MAVKKYSSSSLERRIVGYLKPRIFQMFFVDMEHRFRGKSEHAVDIITKHYDSLTESQQRALLSEYEKVKEKYEPKKGAHKKI